MNWAMYHAAELPGQPAESYSETDVDWAIHQARSIRVPVGTGHGAPHSKGEVDWAVYDAKSKPAPGSHEIERQLRGWQ